VEEQVEQHVEQGNENGIMFDTVLRGYDRRQVDERLSFLRAELAAAEDGLRTSQQRSSSLEGELEQARTKLTQRSDTDMENSFGFRVERILRLAEAEAKQVRTRADNEATELMKQAAADAEERRQQVEQELETRIELAERDVGEREAAVSQRERQVEADAAAFRREADQLRATARSEVEAMRKEARIEVEELRSNARTEADRMLAVAKAEAEKQIADADSAVTEREHAGERELDRLTSLHDEVGGRLEATWKLLETYFVHRQGFAPGREPRSGENQEPDESAGAPAAGANGNGHLGSPIEVATPR
jgi:cell division septum initiation protein DivIVA